MSVAACYLLGAEGKQHSTVITLRGEAGGGMLHVANDKTEMKICPRGPVLVWIGTFVMTPKALCAREGRSA